MSRMSKMEESLSGGMKERVFITAVSWRSNTTLLLECKGSRVVMLPSHRKTSSLNLLRDSCWSLACGDTIVNPEFEKNRR